MSEHDFDDGTDLVEAISGKWYRCKNIKPVSILLDLPNGVLLNVHVSSKRIDVCLKDENDIYHYAADINFKFEEGENHIHLFSPAIEDVHFHDRNHVVSNDLGRLKSVFVNLNLAKKQLVEDL